MRTLTTLLKASLGLISVALQSQTLVTETIRQDGTGSFTSIAAWESVARNLVASNQIVVGQIEGKWSAEEYVPLQFSGWLTSSNCYQILRAVKDARWKGIAQDYTGTNNWRLYCSLQGAENAIYINQEYMRLQNLEVGFYGPSTNGNYRGIHSYLSTENSGPQLLNCLVRAMPNTRAYAGWSGISEGVGNVPITAINCVVDMCSEPFSGTQVYNCTVIVSPYARGDWPAYGTTRAVFNSLSINTPAAGFGGSGGANNIADKSVPSQSGSKQAVIGLQRLDANELYRDYHLGAADTAAFGAGVTDPAAGLYSTDFEDAPRGSLWDVGADQFGAAAPTGAPRVIVTSQ